MAQSTISVYWDPLVCAEGMFSDESNVCSSLLVHKAMNCCITATETAKGMERTSEEKRQRKIRSETRGAVFHYSGCGRQMSSYSEELR